MNVPNHIAIILDGNGRWAKAKGLPRGYGHVKGCANLEQVCYDIKDLGVKYLTVYAFSTENWKRPEDEVQALMKLLRQYLKNCIKRSTKNNMCVRVLGDVSRLEPDMQESIRELEEVTKNNTGLHFQVALNYGSRDEMLRGMRIIAEKVEKGECKPEEITEEMFSESLDTKGIPDPDLLIRTVEKRDFQISSYGSLPIRSFILRMFCGRILIKMS